MSGLHCQMEAAVPLRGFICWFGRNADATSVPRKYHCNCDARAECHVAVRSRQQRARKSTAFRAETCRCCAVCMRNRHKSQGLRETFFPIKRERCFPRDEEIGCAKACGGEKRKLKFGAWREGAGQRAGSLSTPTI